MSNSKIFPINSKKPPGVSEIYSVPNILKSVLGQIRGVFVITMKSGGRNTLKSYNVKPRFCRGWALSAIPGVYANHTLGK